jgi:hypothetical protein
MIERDIIKELRSWKSDEFRKPLVLRGARQTGKTTVVNMFGKEFKQYIYLNLEEESSKNLFLKFQDIDRLVEAIFLENNRLKNIDDTLIFIDEIQEVPQALNMLRYFYEKYPKYCVISAGSLLESLFDNKISFPVGRVEYKVLRPLSFREFLKAMNENSALEYYEKVPFDNIAHEKLKKLFHIYTLIGGMPEIVYRYSKQKDIVALSSVYDSLIGTYIDDVEKYAPNSSSVNIMRHAIRSVFAEAGNRIKFAGFGNSAYSSREIGEALRTIEKAMLIHLIYPTTQTELPFMPDIKKSPRLQVLDTGLLNYMAHLQKDVFGAQDLNNVYRGHITEHIVGQELLAAKTSMLSKPLFWVSEKKDSSSELDFLEVFNGEMIPIEVKSGPTGHLKSLHNFMDSFRGNTAIRLYAGELRQDIVKTPKAKEYKLISMPYFLAAKIGEYIKE